VLQEDNDVSRHLPGGAVFSDSQKKIIIKTLLTKASKVLIIIFLSKKRG
jgi:hypothetical protein